MNTTLAGAAPTTTATGLAGLLVRLRALLERIPYSLLALIARGAAFEVFWRSGQVKLDDWAGTIHLFEEEYKVPLIPPEIAAQMAAGMELGGSVLLLAGLFSRGVALMFIGMVTVIQVFIYPEAWPTHIQWLAFLALLVARGPGVVSLDALVARWLNRGRSAA